MKILNPLLLLLSGAAISTVVWFWVDSGRPVDSRLNNATAPDSSADRRLQTSEASVVGDESNTGSNSPVQENTVQRRLIALETELVQLREALTEEQKGRLALQREIDALEGEVLQWSSTSERSVGPGTSTQSRETSRQDTSIFAEAAPSFFSRNRGQGGAESDLTALVAAGIEPQTAEDLASRLDERTLQLLNLRDQATREDWVGSERFRDEQSALRDSINLRDEVGDSAWDAYLYASGQNNRVGIASIINGSAASNAGVQVGDVIVTYATERIYTVRELQSATRAGERGEAVILQVRRAGTLLDVSVVRGPLGVTLTAGRENPSEAGGL